MAHNPVQTRTSLACFSSSVGKPRLKIHKSTALWMAQAFLQLMVLTLFFFFFFFKLDFSSSRKTLKVIACHQIYICTMEFKGICILLYFSGEGTWCHADIVAEKIQSYYKFLFVLCKRVTNYAATWFLIVTVTNGFTQPGD